MHSIAWNFATLWQATWILHNKKSALAETMLKVERAKLKMRRRRSPFFTFNYQTAIRIQRIIEENNQIKISNSIHWVEYDILMALQRNFPLVKIYYFYNKNLHTYPHLLNNQTNLIWRIFCVNDRRLSWCCLILWLRLGPICALSFFKKDPIQHS